MISSHFISQEKYYHGSFSLVRPKWMSDALGSVSGENIKIAVIDSGCDRFIADDYRISRGISFIKDREGFVLEKNDNYYDYLGHGTACIDIILQFAPSVEILPIKVFASKLETSIEILVAAINYAIESNVDLINLSLGTKLSEALYPLYGICEKAKQRNIVIVSSNANADINSYPAIFENVISVSSMKTNEKFDVMFNEDEIVECFADGFPADALTLNGKRHPMSGNSFASPIVSGIVALLIEKYSVKDIDSVRQLLFKFSMNNNKSSGRRISEIV